MPDEDLPTPEQVAEALADMPGLPEHIDYERLNGLMREIFQEFEQQLTTEEFEAYIGAYVDSDSLSFVATPAVMSSMGIRSAQEVRERHEEIANGALLFVRSFLLGYRFARLKEES